MQRTFNLVFLAVVLLVAVAPAITGPTKDNENPPKADNEVSKTIENPTKPEEEIPKKVEEPTKAEKEPIKAEKEPTKVEKEPAIAEKEIPETTESPTKTEEEVPKKIENPTETKKEVAKKIENKPRKVEKIQKHKLIADDIASMIAGDAEHVADFIEVFAVDGAKAIGAIGNLVARIIQNSVDNAASIVDKVVGKHNGLGIGRGISRGVGIVANKTATILNKTLDVVSTGGVDVARGVADSIYIGAHGSVSLIDTIVSKLIDILLEDDD